MAEKKVESLLDFAIGERLKDCTVCRLPEAVRSQIAMATKKRIARDTLVAWLKQTGWDGPEDDLTVHQNGHHDRKLRELSTNS